MLRAVTNQRGYICIFLGSVVLGIVITLALNWVFFLRLHSHLVSTTAAGSSLLSEFRRFLVVITIVMGAAAGALSYEIVGYYIHHLTDPYARTFTPTQKGRRKSTHGLAL